MSRSGGIHRYYLLVEKIRAGDCPSFSALQRHLRAHSFEISPRTLQRDIDALRFEFDIDIAYDRERNGYRILNGDRSLEETFRFLETSVRAGLVRDAFRDGSELGSSVSFDRPGQLRGLEHLEPLFLAIRNKRAISFTHENYHTGERKRFSAHPHLLKEYEGRWYLYATVPKAGRPLFFGLDRMEKLEVSEQVFSGRTPDLGRLANVIGISGADGEPEDVVLEFSALQGKYVKALPLHPSQTTLRDDAEVLVVRLRVVPNFELNQKILMHGDAVRVLEPAALAEEIAGLHLSAAEKNGVRHGLT